jgi:hypothetical protein
LELSGLLFEATIVQIARIFPEVERHSGVVRLSLQELLVEFERILQKRLSKLGHLRG